MFLPRMKLGVFLKESSFEVPNVSCRQQLCASLRKHCHHWNFYKMNRRILIVTFFLFLGINEIKSQTIEIPYQDFEWNCNFKSSSGNFIIRNRSELKEFSTCNLFSFDFEKYTIIGVQGLNVGHEVPVVVFKILMDNSNKIITVEANFGLPPIFLVSRLWSGCIAKASIRLHKIMLTKG